MFEMRPFIGNPLNKVSKKYRVKNGVAETVTLTGKIEDSVPVEGAHVSLSGGGVLRLGVGTITIRSTNHATLIWENVPKAKQVRDIIQRLSSGEQVTSKDFPDSVSVLLTDEQVILRHLSKLPPYVKESDLSNEELKCADIAMSYHFYAMYITEAARKIEESPEFASTVAKNQIGYAKNQLAALEVCRNRFSHYSDENKERAFAAGLFFSPVICARDERYDEHYWKFVNEYEDLLISLANSVTDTVEFHEKWNSLNALCDTDRSDKHPAAKSIPFPDDLG